METDRKHGEYTDRAAAIKEEIDRDIEERTNLIWALVRENRHSLHSEKYCRLMREAMDTAVAAVCNTIEPLLVEIEDLKRKLTEARAKAKAEADSHEVSIKALQKCNTKLAKLQTELQVLKDKSVVVN